MMSEIMEVPLPEHHDLIPPKNCPHIISQKYNRIKKQLILPLAASKDLISFLTWKTVKDYAWNFCNRFQQLTFQISTFLSACSAFSLILRGWRVLEGWWQRQTSHLSLHKLWNWNETLKKAQQEVLGSENALFVLCWSNAEVQIISWLKTGK